jgi:hypothetical protein
MRGSCLTASPFTVGDMKTTPRHISDPEVTEDDFSKALDEALELTLPVSDPIAVSLPETLKT